jgi:hypothetical protein
MNSAVLVLMAALVALTFRNYRRDARRKKQSRDAVFDECKDLLQAAEKSWNKAHLPVLQGSYAGYAVALSVVEDTIGWRKVPPLWLLVKVEGNRPSRGSLDFIVRPANNEFYSPSWQWDGTLAIPASWPQHAIVKYHEQPADVGVLEPHVPTLFADAKVKELLVTPSLVRLTYLAKQAERGEYLIMRNAVYNDSPISRDEVETLLKQAIAIRQDLENAATAAS